MYSNRGTVTPILLCFDRAELQPEVIEVLNDKVEKIKLEEDEEEGGK